MHQSWSRNIAVLNLKSHPVSDKWNREKISENIVLNMPTMSNLSETFSVNVTRAERITWLTILIISQSFPSFFKQK